MDNALSVSEFCDRFNACAPGRAWAIANCSSMADAWDKLPSDWLVWVATREGVLTDRDSRLFACWCVKHTPIGNGMVVWNLLADERLRIVVDVAERYALGLASHDELSFAIGVANECDWNAGSSASLCAADGDAWRSAWYSSLRSDYLGAWDAQASELRRHGNPFTGNYSFES